jgi:hypothetical protein
LLLILPIGGVPAQEVGDDIRDAAARIDYGFYTEDLSLIRAAIDTFSDGSNQPWANYLRAYASYRAALVSLSLQRSASTAVDDCLGAAEIAAQSPQAEAEATVLIAACAALAAADEPVRSVLHQRRYRRAAGRVESLDPGNPRLLLVTLRSGYSGEESSPPEPDAVLEAFDARGAPFAFPDWGEAEALAIAGKHRLDAGDRRGARDYIERALLAAPDYRFALKLAADISNFAATN